MRAIPSRFSAASIVGGLVAAVGVTAIGLAMTALRTQPWTATSSLVVLPNAAVVSQAELASYYDTLSRGQVTATFAQVIQSQSSPVRPGNVGLTEDQAKPVTVTVIAVPNTSIINVNAEAPTADQAARVANRVAASGRNIVEQLRSPYIATAVDLAEPGLAQPVGPSTLLLSLVVGVVALGAGVGVQQVLWLLGLRRARRAPAETAAAPPPIEEKPSATVGKRFE